jgi:hypothetical protein
MRTPLIRGLQKSWFRSNTQKHQNRLPNSKAAKPMAVDDFVIYKSKTTDMQTDN